MKTHLILGAESLGTRSLFAGRSCCLHQKYPVRGIFEIFWVQEKTETLPEAQRTQGIASKLELSLQQKRMSLALVEN